MTKKTNSSGFSFSIVLVVVVVISTLVLGGYFVWQRNKDDESASKTKETSQSDKKNTSEDDAKQADPYGDWRMYSSTTYGISFRYPTDWKVDEGVADSPSSATKQEYAINLKRNDDMKYSDTISIEVLGQDLAASTAWYDSSFAQMEGATVSKTTNELKGKRSVQYAVSNGGVETKVYLFSVNSRTYVFSSLNEELNVQTDGEYWTKFDKLFKSLLIS